MDSFDGRAARLVQRIAFDTTMHCRLDILSPRENDDHLLARMLDELDAFIDHGGCAASRSRSQLPDGLRSVRYSMSPLIQKKLDKAGCLGAHQYRLMPTTETEMIDFIEEDCPIPRAEWPTLERIGHVTLIHTRGGFLRSTIPIRM